MFIPTPTSASSGSILARQQLRAKTKSLTFPPLSIARYTFIQLGVRSLANASRARQFNPLNPPGWGGYRFLKQIWQPWSVVRGRSCVRGRVWSCVVGHAWSCAVVRAWSVIRGRARSVVRGRTRSVVRSCRFARFAASTAVTRMNERTKERTTYNNRLNPPGVG